MDGEETQVVDAVREGVHEHAVRDAVRAVPEQQVRRVGVVLVVREPAEHALGDDVAGLHSGAGNHVAAGPGGVGARDGAGAVVQLLDVNVEVGGHDETRDGGGGGGRGDVGAGGDGVGSSAFQGEAGRIARGCWCAGGG